MKSEDLRVIIVTKEMEAELWIIKTMTWFSRGTRRITGALGFWNRQLEMQARRKGFIVFTSKISHYADMIYSPTDSNFRIINMSVVSLHAKQCPEMSCTRGSIIHCAGLRNAGSTCRNHRNHHKSDLI